jgi:hypothetical protein
MIANRMTPVFVATALIAVLAVDASARDRWPGDGRHGYYSHHSGHGHHFGRNRLRMLSDQALGGASRVSTARRKNRSDYNSIQTAGSIGIVSGGSIFYAGGYREIYLGGSAGEDQAPRPAPKAKIIDVNEAMAGGNLNAPNGCAFEMGVCVIRGRN